MLSKEGLLFCRLIREIFKKCDCLALNFLFAGPRLGQEIVSGDWRFAFGAPHVIHRRSDHSRTADFVFALLVGARQELLEELEG